MSENSLMESAQAAAGGGRQARTAPYTAKDFQLEVLGQLAEMQELTEGLRESFVREQKKNQEANSLLRFDGRTLVAIGAIALSLTGYILQDARNSSKRDSEIETTKARVVDLERIAAINTEGRIRSEMQLTELREGQVEIKGLIHAQSVAARKATAPK